eukprot:scaffold6007_cov183-Amphora_coffeaeformis.AAC.37
MSLECLTDATKNDVFISILPNGAYLGVGQAICQLLPEGTLQFGLDSEGHVLFQLQGTEEAEIIWHEESATGDILLVDEDFLALLDDNGDTVWEAGGCTVSANKDKIDTLDHQLEILDDQVRLIDDTNDKTLWRIDVEDGQVQQFCPEHKLEEGAIAGVVIGSFFAFLLAVVLLVCAYRGSLGNSQQGLRRTAPVTKDQPTEADEKKKKKEYDAAASPEQV